MGNRLLINCLTGDTLGVYVYRAKLNKNNWRLFLIRLYFFIWLRHLYCIINKNLTPSLSAEYCVIHYQCGPSKNIIKSFILKHISYLYLTRFFHGKPPYNSSGYTWTLLRKFRWHDNDHIHSSYTVIYSIVSWLSLLAKRLRNIIFVCAYDNLLAHLWYVCMASILHTR